MNYLNLVYDNNRIGLTVVEKMNDKQIVIELFKINPVFLHANESCKKMDLF